MSKEYEDEVIKVKINDEFYIELDSNPTTGYRWEAKFDENYIDLKKKKYSPSSDRIGAGGKVKFDFQTLKTGETKIELAYKRLWERDPIKKKLIIVRIG